MANKLKRKPQGQSRMDTPETLATLSTQSKGQKKMSEKTESEITNGHSRDTGNIWQTKHRTKIDKTYMDYTSSKSQYKYRSEANHRRITEIHGRSLSWLGTGTSIKSVGVKLVCCVRTVIQSAFFRNCKVMSHK